MSVDFYTLPLALQPSQTADITQAVPEDEIGCGATTVQTSAHRSGKPEIVDDLTWDEFAKLTDEEQAKRRTTCVDCRNELESDENLLLFLLNSSTNRMPNCWSEFPGS